MLRVRELIFMLKLSEEHLQIIRTHAESTYPQECCGILLGHHKTVVEVKPTENVWGIEVGEGYSRTRRYAIAPKVLLETQKEARDKGISIIGIYHSHPDNPAIPSEYDHMGAWQEYSYIIASVQKGQVSDIKSWVLDEKSQFQEESIL
jgi:proteasome lid subunit RPN8/RPN11